MGIDPLGHLRPAGQRNRTILRFVYGFFSLTRRSDRLLRLRSRLGTRSSRGLTREEAYILCSVAVDLKVSEIVDAPNWIISAFLPETIFGGGGAGS